MGLADWDEKELARLDKGLSYLGWHSDMRLTNDDGLLLQNIAEKTLELVSKRTLTSQAIDKLAVDAYSIIRFQVVGVEARAHMAQIYADSKNLCLLMRLIDEFTLAFFSGYYTAAFALQLIVLESYLRSLLGWRPGDARLKFGDLRKSVAKFPSCQDKNRVIDLIDGLYALYDPLKPTQFFFNRHGLLHGIRGVYSLDELNCARMFVLFDLFTTFELELEGCSGIIDDEYKLRFAAYKTGGIRRLHQALFKLTESWEK